MSSAPAGRKKVVTPPITAIFRFLQKKERVQIMLYENTQIRMEGIIIGFDEYMNLVLDEATEIDRKHKTTRKVGRVLLKGDNITLIMGAPQSNNQSNNQPMQQSVGQ